MIANLLHYLIGHYKCPLYQNELINYLFPYLLLFDAEGLHWVMLTKSINTSFPPKCIRKLNLISSATFSREFRFHVIIQDSAVH